MSECRCNDRWGMWDELRMDELPNGTRIEVVWCGGNGPHTYTVDRDEYGGIYARSKTDRPDYFDPERRLDRPSRLHRMTVL